eukprot:630968-Prorocentrum_minimum.AAC.1
MVQRRVNCIVLVITLFVVTVTCRADPILQHIGDNSSSDIGRRGYTEFRDGGEDPVAVHAPKMSARWSMLSSPGTEGSPLGQEQVTAALFGLVVGGRNSDEANIPDGTDLLPPTERRRYVRHSSSATTKHCSFSAGSSARFTVLHKCSERSCGT